MRLSDAVTSAKPLNVVFDGGAILHITYVPADFTPRELAKMQQEKNSEQIVDQMLRMVKSWDLTEDDGYTPIPLVRDRMLDVSTTIYLKIGEAVMAEVRPSGEAGKSSAAT